MQKSHDVDSKGNRRRQCDYCDSYYGNGIVSYYDNVKFCLCCYMKYIPDHIQLEQRVRFIKRLVERRKNGIQKKVVR